MNKHWSSHDIWPLFQPLLSWEGNTIEYYSQKKKETKTDMMLDRGFEDFRIYLLFVYWHSNKWGVTRFQTLFGLLSASCQPL